MWTTKRVLLLLAGFALFFSAYLTYAYFLGGIDGLPPLPAAYLRSTGSEDLPLPPQPSRPPVDIMLQKAFSEGWEDILMCSIKLHVSSKNLVLAAHDFVILEDGRVQLTPFNLAIFGKGPSDIKFPEINTVRSQVANLTFDQPVRNHLEMANRKIVAAELVGDVKINNNRRSLQRDDDLSLFTPGPLYYREDLHQIWTMASVRMLDTQSKPEPTTITAEGMDLQLVSEKEAAKPAAVLKKNQTISGVEKIVLRSNVEMHLWVDSQSGFLGSPTTPASANKAPAEAAGNVAGAAAGKETSDAVAAPASPDKSKVVIKTEGPFCYDVPTDHASFDIPKKVGRWPEKVIVTRQSGTADNQKRDSLKCTHLELQFQRKPESKGGRDDRSVDLAIENAHATGPQVELEAEAEALHAIGNDFFYDAQKHYSILKGTPEMVAMKDGHEIHAPELHLVNAGQKDAQQARAKGAGTISMLDRVKGKRTMHARWKNELEFAKEGAFDCLILIGDASFEDRENDQVLRADKLKVWLEPARREANVSGEQQRMRPHHLDAAGHVTARSAELIVREPTEHLVVWFKDAPHKVELPQGKDPSAAQPTPPPEPAPVVGRTVGLDRSAPPAPAAPQLRDSPASPGAAPPSKPNKPIILSAHSVESFVVRTGERNELDKLWCKGTVHVQQDPSAPEDKGVDIRGDTLQLNHSPDGSVLVVTGNAAQVQMNKLTILGPEVNIDQKSNKAWVNGTGAMQMLTNARLSDGEKLAQPSVLTIHWNKDMFFNGQYALFHGGIQAEQDSALLVCQEMQAFLDRPVSFKEGEKGGQAAKVKELVCDKSVRIEDTTRLDKRKDGPLTRYSRLTAPVVDLNNEDGVVNASGPGVVHLLQLGPVDETIPNPASDSRPPKGTPSGKPKNDKEVLKLTRVNYLDRLYANNNKRTATFYGSVEVLHLPTDNADIVVDIDHPPPGCMYMRCEQLKVFTHKEANGTTTQEMEAIKKVIVQAQEFWGLANVVKYDESKELVIFESGEGGLATLFRVKNQGVAPEKLTGKKIFYWRRTNDVKIEGGQGISVQ